MRIPVYRSAYIHINAFASRWFCYHIIVIFYGGAYINLSRKIIDLSSFTFTALESPPCNALSSDA